MELEIKKARCYPEEGKEEEGIQMAQVRFIKARKILGGALLLLALGALANVQAGSENYLLTSSYNHALNAASIKAGEGFTALAFAHDTIAIPATTGRPYDWNWSRSRLPTPRSPSWLRATTAQADAQAQAQPQPPPQPPKSFQKAILQVAAFFSFGAGTRAKAGSGALITPEGHLLTNSHVVRSGPGFCAEPPVQGDVAPLIVLLVTEDLSKPPVPRYVADFVTDDSQLDITVLKISRELKEGLNNLRALEEQVAAAGSRKAFLAQWTQEGSVSSIPIKPLTLWDSDAALVGQRVIALGYPRPRGELRNPPLNIDDRGNIQAKPEGFLRVGAAFAAPGSSGGAMVRAEEGQEYLIGLICAGEFGTAAVALARPINAAVDRPVKEAKLVTNQAPVADFLPQPQQPCPLETVIFDASQGTARGGSRDRDGVIQSCRWEFTFMEAGQERTIPQEGCRVERSFPQDSRPRVILTVEDDKQLADFFSQEILLRLEEGPCKAKLFDETGQLKQEFDSIQEAIEHAGPREVIEIVPPTPPLVCAESLEIKGKQSLTLRGARSLDDAPAFVIAGDGVNPTILIADSERITIEGLKITQGNPGIRVVSSRSVRIKQSVLRENRGHGIQWVSASGRVSDSRLEDNIADPEGLSGHGLTVEQQAEVAVLDTKIVRNAAAGVAAAVESAAELEFVQLCENEDGMLLDRAKGKIVDTEISENRKGIFAKNSQLEIKQTSILENQIGVELQGEAAVVIQVHDTQIVGNIEGLIVNSSAQLDLSEVEVVENDTGVVLKALTASLANVKAYRNRVGVHILSRESSVSNSRFLENQLVGILIEGKANLQEVTISKNFTGIFSFWGDFSLLRSEVTRNSYYGIVSRGGTVAIQDCEITRSGFRGIVIELAEATILRTIVEENGTLPNCSRAGSICNGITLITWSQATIVDSVIRNNTDWGVAATLQKCGYPSDNFQGSVAFQGANEITGNNKSGNHQGEVCLP